MIQKSNPIKMSIKSEMNDTGKDLICGQIKSLKNLITIAAPLTFLGTQIIYWANLQNFYDTEKYTLYSFIVILLLFLANFFIPYQRRKKLINHVIQNVDVTDLEIILYTYSFYDDYRTHTLSRKDIRLIKGYKKDKEIDIFNIKKTFRLETSSSGTFYFLSSFFDNWDLLYNELTRT